MASNLRLVRVPRSARRARYHTGATRPQPHGSDTRLAQRHETPTCSRVAPPKKDNHWKARRRLVVWDTRTDSIHREWTGCCTRATRTRWSRVRKQVSAPSTSEARRSIRPRMKRPHSEGMCGNWVYYRKSLSGRSN